jgi:hypothetical protein
MEVNSWGSRLITSRGREVLKTIERNNLKHLSTGETTHCPSDRNKLPELVDFCVTISIPQDFAAAKSCFDLSSDHSPVLITITETCAEPRETASLSNRHTNWDDFRCLINKRLTSNASLITKEDTEAAVKFFDNAIQWTG